MWTSEYFHADPQQKPVAESSLLGIESKSPPFFLEEKILDRSAVIAVVGLGYVGLPFAVEKAKVGYTVLGVDIEPQKIDMLNRGENWIPDVANEELAELSRRGVLRGTLDFETLADADVIVIAVPTPLTRNFTPDMLAVVKAAESVGRHLRAGQLVCLESTIFPGATEDIVRPILENGGLKADRDFFLAFSPERVDPGNAFYKTKNTTKVVGGIGPRSHELAVLFYSQTIEKITPVSNALTAEMVKLFENTFRSVNIGLVNEMALLCDRMKVNVWELLDAAFTKPFGIMPFYPGPGVGGHCIPIDPHFMEWKAKEFNFHTRFVSLAGEVNRRMPEFVAEKAFRLLNNMGVAASRAKILLLGVAYKQNMSDCREAPAVDVMAILNKNGAALDYHDPHVPFVRDAERGLSLESVSLSKEALKAYDLVIITARHESVDYDLIAENAKLVFDTVNATRRVVNKARVVLL